MGKLINLIVQKFLPMTKKSMMIRFRRKNGRWIELLVPPSKESFHFGKEGTPYNIVGVPDIEDDTNQREFMFFEGIPYPIQSHSQHPEVLVMGREAGNQQIMLINAEERGFQKALLLKGGKKTDFMIFVLIAVAINLLISIAIAFTIFTGG